VTKVALKSDGRQINGPSVEGRGLRIAAIVDVAIDSKETMRTAVILGSLALLSAIVVDQSAPDRLQVGQNGDNLVAQRMSAGAMFEAAEITHSLVLLRSESIRSRAWAERRTIAALQETLDHFITKVGGELLLDEAARRLEFGTDPDRERAALILVRYPSLPEAVTDRFRRSSRLDLRCFGAWFSSQGPAERYQSDEKLVRHQEPVNDEPFREVLPVVRERMRLTPYALAETKTEYQKSYRRVFLSAIDDYWEFIPFDQRYEVDFDGDGVPELIAAARVPDGWDVGRMATLVLKRVEGQWSLVGFREWHHFERGRDGEPGALDLVVADFDGDTLPEVVELTSVVGTWGWAKATYWDEKTVSHPPLFRGRSTSVAPDPGTGRPLVVVYRAFNPTIQGGKALYLTTALATRLDLVSFTDDSVADVTTILVRGNGW
jgi:hypothetical protein